MRRLVLLDPVNLPTPHNTIVSAVGDSITLSNAAVSGGTVPSIASSGKYQAQTCTGTGVGAYLTWACILPKTGDATATGRMRWGGIHATGGFTIQQVLDTHIRGADSPLNDNPKPGMCVVCVGQNDAASLATQAGITAALVTVKKIYDRLIRSDILPIPAACPPNNSSGAAVQNFNAQLRTMATAMGLPFVDFNTPCANGDGTWKTNYNALGTDPVHPSVIGAVAMGQALRDGIDRFLPNVVPTLATVATDDDAKYLYKNGSFTDDGNADGVPDGGQTQATTYWTQTPNGCAWTLGARAGYNGQALRWNKTTDPGTSQLQSTGAGSPITILTNSMRVSWGFVAEVTAWDPSTQIVFEGFKQSDSTTKPFRLNMLTDAFYTSPVAPFVWFQEWTTPPDYFNDANVGKTRWSITMFGTGTNTGNMYMGQWTVRDDT